MNVFCSLSFFRVLFFYKNFLWLRLVIWNEESLIVILKPYWCFVGTKVLNNILKSIVVFKTQQVLRFEVIDYWVDLICIIAVSFYSLETFRILLSMMPVYRPWHDRLLFLLVATPECQWFVQVIKILIKYFVKFVYSRFYLLRLRRINSASERVLVYFILVPKREIYFACPVWRNNFRWESFILSCCLSRSPLWRRGK